MTGITFWLEVLASLLHNIVKTKIGWDILNVKLKLFIVFGFIAFKFLLNLEQISSKFPQNVLFFAKYEHRLKIWMHIRDIIHWLELRSKSRRYRLLCRLRLQLSVNIWRFSLLEFENTWWIDLRSRLCVSSGIQIGGFNRWRGSYFERSFMTWVLISGK